MAGILTFPVLIFALLLLFDRYQDYLGFGFEVGKYPAPPFADGHRISVAMILYAGVLAALAGYFYRLDHPAMTLADKIMHAFTSKPPSITKSIIE